MITLKKVKVFERYSGSKEKFDYAKFWHSLILTGNEFYTIQRIVSDLKLIEKGLAADSYEDQIRFMMYETCDNRVTIDYLKQVAARLQQI